MSKRLEVVRALVTERLSAAADEIFQLFVSAMAEYEREQGLLRATEPSHGRARTPGGAEEAEEAEEPGRAAAGVQTVSRCRRTLSPVEPEIQAQIFIKEDPDLCLKQEPEEPKEPFAVLSMKVDGNEVSARHQSAERNDENERNAEFGGDADDSLAAYLEKEGHGDAFVTDTTETLLPQAFYFSDIVGFAQSSDKTLNETHETEKETKRHKCAQCGKVYLHRPSLFRHILTHKEQKPFKCSVCQKGFSQKPHLTVHMRIHTGEKPFSCPFCAKTFSNKSNVSQHLRVHTGEKPFACSICEARFRCTKTLSTHMTVHTGDRPFECSDCGVRYKQQASLDVHRRTHSGEKPYSCAVCGRCFAQRQSLKKHLKLHAKQETPSGGDDEVQQVYES